MNSKSPRVTSHEKDETLKIFIEKDFTNYKLGPAATSKPATSPLRPDSISSISQKFEMSIERDSLPYFKDLIGLEQIREKLSKNLTVFLSRTEEYCVFNLWSGKSLTGKTTLAKRLSGQGGFPAFSSGGVKTFYYDCFSVKDNLDNLRKDWLDKSKLPNNSVIFIDEIEKCFDEKYKVVDDTFAKKFRKLFEDLSRTRKLFFIFITSEKPTRENVQRLLDVKLTSITDFDLKFPEWTTENLLNIILETIDAQGYKITPQGAAELAAHANQHGMILEVQGILQQLDVDLRRKGDKMITEQMIQNIIKSRS